MRRFGWWLGRILLALLLTLGVLLAPILWIETGCRGTGSMSVYQPVLIDPGQQRPEARTFLTYPEWHIVHAYDDYAKVIGTADPHDYRFLMAITGFWSSLCTMSEMSAKHGGFPWPTKQMVYTIGVSFTAELAMKALYEETFGRIATLLRGPQPAPLDTLSARQAADYAAFLQQVPWYKWDFARDTSELTAGNTGTLRDRERNVALGLEYRAKAAYARMIAAAVASVGADALRLQMIVTGIEAVDLEAIDGVDVVAHLPQGIQIEAPRYRQLTLALDEMARQGADFVEIAGNDDIMLTAISSDPAREAIFSLRRQGYGDTRSLIAVKVADLADALRGFHGSPVRLEHIHDY